MSEPILPVDVSELSAAANDAIEPTGRADCAWRHGMYARRIAVGEEQFAAFESLRTALADQYRPRTTVAWMLVDRLARLQWKLMRAEEAEVRMVELAQTYLRSWSRKVHRAPRGAAGRPRGGQ